MQLPAYIPSPAVKVQELDRVGRKLRKPTHNFMVKYPAYSLQPFLLAPVLPGDTMKNLLMQANVISDAVKHPYLGAWTEFYFFYVKLRDLPERDSIETMLIANGAAPASTPADSNHYYNGQGVNWSQKCLNRITDCYFRSEEELTAVVKWPELVDAAGRPRAKGITNPGWMDSVKSESDVPASDGTPLPGDYWPDLPPHLAAFSAAYTQWQQMQSLEIVPPKFEDYLKTFGVHVPKESKVNPHIPELMRYVRKFTQPKNVVGEQGTVNSQFVWDVAERADKDRFFAEPGFIFGVTTTRLKMYSGNQVANVSSFLNDGLSWLPALLSPDPFTSLKKFVGGPMGSGVGPLGSITTAAESYWVDLADLFVYGDQFTNYSLTDPGFAGIPQLDGGKDIWFQKEYPPVAAVDACFVTAVKNLIKVEGRVDLNIMSRVVDTTP